MTPARTSQRPAEVLRGAFLFFVTAAAIGGVHAAGETAKPPRMWDCTYVAAPEPAIHCELSAAGPTRTASNAPLWDATAVAPRQAIDIPLFTAPRMDRTDRLIGLAQSAACGDQAGCYVTWHAPARR